VNKTTTGSASIFVDVGYTFNFTLHA